MKDVTNHLQTMTSKRTFHILSKENDKVEEKKEDYRFINAKRSLSGYLFDKYMSSADFHLRYF